MGILEDGSAVEPAPSPASADRMPVERANQSGGPTTQGVSSEVKAVKDLTITARPAEPIPAYVAQTIHFRVSGELAEGSPLTRDLATAKIPDTAPLLTLPRDGPP